MSYIPSNNGEQSTTRPQPIDIPGGSGNGENNTVTDGHDRGILTNESRGYEVEEGHERPDLEEENIEDEDEPVDSPMRLRMRVLQFIQSGGIYSMFQGVNDNDDDDYDDDSDVDYTEDEDYDQYGVFCEETGERLWPLSHPDDQNRFPKIPSEIGAELMRSGNFGVDETANVKSVSKNSLGKKKTLAMRIFARELAIESPVQQKINQKLMAQGMIPSSNADVIIQFKYPVYSGQFSDDGNFFFAVSKDFKVRMYDTSNPYDWRYYKTVSYPSGRWTLTDASLSPDNKYLAYTSIDSNVCLAPTDPNDIGDPYILDLARGPNDIWTRHRSGFGIWSIRYSGDGRNLAAGTTGGSIVVYDVEARIPIHRIKGHTEDVNAVCLADNSSPHILYSGSDDTTLKVWDTRSMGNNGAAGTFLGHIEGLTYIDSKGDGRYILSNGKDQSTKLWDVRMAMSPQQYEKVKSTRKINRRYFDYRFENYKEKYWYKDPHDCSLVTYRGHRILKTLIRCHFSPQGSTNSRYVYSGSQDGMVYIWNLDATLAGVIDVYKSTYYSYSLDPNDPYNMRNYEGQEWSTCVRDASWHPTAPIIVASAWNGIGASFGTCTLHSWNDDAEEDEAEPSTGIRLNEKLENILKLQS